MVSESVRSILLLLSPSVALSLVPFARVTRGLARCARNARCYFSEKQSARFHLVLRCGTLRLPYIRPVNNLVYDKLRRERALFPPEDISGEFISRINARIDSTGNRPEILIISYRFIIVVFVTLRKLDRRVAPEPGTVEDTFLQEREGEKRAESRLASLAVVAACRETGI